MLLTASSNLLLSPRTPKVPGFALPTSAPQPLPPRRPRRRPRRRCLCCSPKPTSRRAKTTSRSAQTCHNFKEGAGPKIGPDLWNVVGRPVASFPGFVYSDSLKAIGGNWTYDKLNAWIADPKKDGLGHQDGLRRGKRRAEAGRYSGLSAHAQRLAGPAPEVRPESPPRLAVQPARELAARKSKELQGKCLDFLGFLWPNWDFSTGYSEKNKKIGDGLNSRPRLCAIRIEHASP